MTKFLSLQAVDIKGFMAVVTNRILFQTKKTRSRREETENAAGCLSLCLFSLWPRDIDYHQVLDFIGAKLTFAMLLHYAWQNDFCFPGQETLAKDMGAGKRSIVRFLKELEDNGFVAVKRRGQGKSNLYQLILKPVGWRP